MTPKDYLVAAARLLPEHWSIEYDEFDDREYLAYNCIGREYCFDIHECPADAVMAGILLSSGLVHEVDQLEEYQLISYGRNETILVKDEGETLATTCAAHGARSINELVCIVDSGILLK